MMEKIDKFYIVMGVIIVVMSALVIYSGHSLFKAFSTSYEEEPQDQLVRINEDKLNDVYTWSFNKETISLEIR